MGMNSLIKEIENMFSSFISIMATFSVKDLIDIILVAFVIYSAVKLVRETRAAQLIRGLGMLLIIYLLAVWLNLSMMVSLLKTIFEFGVLAMIVLFQPEIRKALEQIGRSKFIRKYFKPSADKQYEIAAADLNRVIAAVVDAATVFQRSKTGALIVFERQTKLGDIINTGTIVDARPSAAIIGNLFFNKAPLHDGAVIIRNGSIYAAGCILPLTKNPNIDINLGTRHRAGIGITEESDALVVIISEETGVISTAMNGKLQRDHTRVTLTELLEKELLPDRADFSDSGIFSLIKKGRKEE